MESQINSLAVPRTAAQAKAFVAPSSFSFPMAGSDITPPSEQQLSDISQSIDIKPSTDIAPATPVSTPGNLMGTNASVSGIVPTLQNIVATVNLECRLDLKTIALHARNAEYNPKVC